MVQPLILRVKRAREEDALDTLVVAAPPPKRRRTAAVGDRVVLTLDALKGVVTKENKRTGWFTVKFEDGDMDSFRAAELRVI